jgi:uncharacterized protein (DUF3084 family)
MVAICLGDSIGPRGTSCNSVDDSNPAAYANDFLRVIRACTGQLGRYRAQRRPRPTIPWLPLPASVVNSDEGTRYSACGRAYRARPFHMGDLVTGDEIESACCHVSMDSASARCRAPTGERQRSRRRAISWGVKRFMSQRYPELLEELQERAALEGLERLQSLSPGPRRAGSSSTGWHPKAETIKASDRNMGTRPQGLAKIHSFVVG